MRCAVVVLSRHAFPVSVAVPPHRPVARAVPAALGAQGENDEEGQHGDGHERRPFLERAEDASRRDPLRLGRIIELRHRGDGAGCGLPRSGAKRASLIGCGASDEDENARCEAARLVGCAVSNRETEEKEPDEPEKDELTLLAM
jgi:hypothetical protein